MTTSRIGLIWAESEGRIIGNHGVMPWHLPEDLAHFKQLTVGNPVVMGRKTWDSLPPRFRPLTGRQNIVITRQPDWRADGAEVAHSFPQALQLAESSAPERVWVIGGAQVFASAIAVADRLEVTEIRTRVDGDTTAPAIDEKWQQVDADPTVGWHTSCAGLQYRFFHYTRR